MKRILLLVVLFFGFCFAQIEIILDNDDEDFSVQGTWSTKTSANCYNGTGRYKLKGTGENYAQWVRDISFPGKYLVEFWSMRYNYARDANCFISTSNGDSLIIIDQFYRPVGWDSIGIFSIPEVFTFKVTDFYADTGKFVYADAIRLTYVDSTFNIGGTVETGLMDLMSYIQVDLFISASDKLIETYYLPPNQRTFLFSGLPEGQYKIKCSAWGYDTLTVDPIDLQNEDLTNLNLILTPSSSLTRHDLEGTVILDDSSSSSLCRIYLFESHNSHPVRTDSVGHNESFIFEDLPEGEYRLLFQADGYLSDSTTFNVINLNQDMALSPLVLYAYFQVAWCSDMHIGSGNDAAFQGVVSNINSIKEQLDFVINSGDVTEKGLNSEFISYKNYIASCQIPVYHVAGNHDTKWSESGLQYFINNISPLHFSLDHKGFHFIGMNSGTPMKGGSGYVDPAEILWLREDLASLSDSTMPIVFITHMPMNVTNLVNYWKVLDILKQYNTVFVMVGHGHVNSKYDFEGIPGAMTMDTYNSTTSGFSIVSFSKKEISVTPFLNSTDAVGTTWLRVPYTGAIQPKIEFPNLSNGEIITSSKTIQIHTENAMISGTYAIRTASVGSGSLSGSGNNWSMDINPAGLENGSHVLSVTLTDASGNAYSRSIEFYSEDGSYPKATWRFNAQSIIISTPAFDSSQVYFGASDGRIYALDINDGTPAWTPYQTDASIFSSPAVKDSTLYIGSSDGNLYAISTNTGTLKWTFNTGKAVISAVVVVDSLAYFAGNNILYAVNIDTREKVWEYSTGGLIECKPAIAGENIVVTSWDRNVHCINRFTGTKNWKWNKQSSFYYAPAACWPVVSPDKVFVTDPAKNLTAISLATGATIWESGGDPQSWESIGISGDKSRIYVRTLDGYLYAFNTSASTKELTWSTNVEYGYDSNPSMPVEKYGTLFSGGKRGFVASVVGSNGTLHWRYWASQALVSTVTPIDGAHVLAVSLDGTVTLIEGDPSEKIETSENTIPIKNSLLAPFPNPFNSTTKIRYTLKDPQDVEIAIYDITGREVYSSQVKNQGSGYHEINWQGCSKSGQSLPSGLYFVKLESKTLTATSKVMLLK